MTLEITNNNNLIETLQQTYPIVVNVGFGDLGSFQAAALAAEEDADRAEAARDDASAIAGIREFQTVAVLLANATLSYTAGTGLVVVSAGDVIRTRAEGFAYQVAASGATDQDMTTAGGVKLYALTFDARPTYAPRNVADLIQPFMDLGQPETVVLRKCRADYHENAIYRAQDATGRFWDRMLFTQRFNTGLAGLPRHTLTTLAGLYPRTSVTRHAANNVSETRGTAASVTQNSAASTRVGTWSTPATVLTTTDVTWSSTVGDTITWTISGVERIDLRGLLASNGGIGRVTITAGGVEIAEANYLLPSDHLVNFISTATGNTTMHFPLAAGLNTATTYTVQVQVHSSNPAGGRVYTAGLLGFAAIAYNAVGIHGILVDASLGGLTNGMSITPGTTVVYQVTNATKVDWRYIKTSVGSIATVQLYSNAGALVFNGTLDQYSASGSTATKFGAAQNLTKGTYFLHVTNGKTRNASATAYRFYDTGVYSYDQTIAGTAGIDEFDDLDVLQNIASPNTGTDWALIANGNLEQALRIRKPSDADSAKEYVGGIHGFETLSSITYRVNGAVVDYAGAAVGATFSGSSISITTSTTLKFPSDNSNFANVTTVMHFSKWGYTVTQTTTTLADAVVYDDFAAMLIGPNTQMSGGTYGKSQGGNTGGGFSIFALDRNYTLTAYDDSGTLVTYPAKSMALVNGSFAVLCALLEAPQVPGFMRTGAFRNNEALGLLQDRVDNTIKGYIRTFSVPSTGATIPAGASWTTKKHYRVFRGDYRPSVGAI